MIVIWLGWWTKSKLSEPKHTEQIFSFFPKWIPCFYNMAQWRKSDHSTYKQSRKSKLSESVQSFAHTVVGMRFGVMLTSSSNHQTKSTTPNYIILSWYYVSCNFCSKEVSLDRELYMITQWETFTQAHSSSSCLRLQILVVSMSASSVLTNWSKFFYRRYLLPLHLRLK